VADVLELVDSGLVYRNPKPHLRSIHAWHPSLAQRDDGVILAAFDLGEAVESLDYGTWLSRSHDEGQTWEPPGPLFRDNVSYRSTHAVRISRMPEGTLVAFGGRFHRDNPEEGLTNRANLGYVPVDLIFLKSHDGGENWVGPVTIPNAPGRPEFRDLSSRHRPGRRPLARPDRHLEGLERRGAERDEGHRSRVPRQRTDLAGVDHGRGPV
jgi:hypothetical protein